MTDPVIRIESVRLSVEPGGQVQTVITIQNPGDIVEGYRLDVVGDGPAGWAQVLPDEVQVYPGQDSTAVLVFNPPADAAAGSGSFPFAVRARSVVDEGTSAVAEGDLDLGRVFGLQAKLTPVTSTGRWRGKHLVQFTNWGNAPVRLKVTATDPDEKLGFLLYPELVEVPIGATSGAAMRVRTKKPFVRGQPVRLPFTILAEPDPPEPAAMGPGGPMPVIADPRRASVDGAFNQRPILSRMVVVLGVLLLAAVGVGVLLAVKSGPQAQPPVALGTGVPRNPTGLTAAAGSDPTTIELAWDGQPALDPYKLYTVSAEGRTSAVVPVDGALNGYTVTGLQPGTKYCFRLQAVRGTTASGLTAPACADTGAVPVTSSVGPTTVVQTITPSGSSPAPSGSDIATTPSVSGSAGSSTAPVGSGPASPPVSSGPASAPLSVPPVIVPPTGGPTGSAPPTGPATPTQPTSGTPGSTAPPTSGPGSVTGSPSQAPPTVVPTSGGGVGIRFRPTDFLGVINLVPNVEPSSQQSALRAQQDALALGLPAQILLTKDYPGLLLFGTTPKVDTFLIYVGPFGSRALADAFCAGRPACMSVQPAPGG